MENHKFATGLELKSGEHIDYKRPVEDKLTVGVIRKFQQAPNSDSIWMLITELENSKNRDWVSCDAWKEQKDAGLFDNKKQIVIEDDNSNKSPDTDLPF